MTTYHLEQRQKYTSSCPLCRTYHLEDRQKQTSSCPLCRTYHLEDRKINFKLSVMQDLPLGTKTKIHLKLSVMQDLCHTLILDLKILIQFSLLFSKNFQIQMCFLLCFSCIHYCFSLLNFCIKSYKRGILVISYKGTHFLSLQFVPESFQLVCINF